MSAGAQGGASGAREEQMEEEMEIEEDSNSTVAMPAARGTFISDTATSAPVHESNVCSQLLVKWTLLGGPPCRRTT